MEFRLEDKVAIVTGAGRGIGKCIALTFAESGADVVVAARTVEQIEQTATEIRKLGRRALAIQTDTSQRNDVENMVQKVMDQYGVIDILVNGAGIIIRKPLLEFPEEEWDKIIDIDLKGYYLCAQAVGKRMVEQKKGNIINITSQYGFKVTPGFGAYSIAKAGIIMLTRALALELSEYGIRVSAIAPGMVRTEFSRTSWSNPNLLKQYEASVPLRRIAEPSDIAASALMLASDASSYITGHTLVIDGGALA